MENAMQVGETQGIERASRAASIGPSSQGRVIDVRPRLDVLENAEAIRILADVPGVDAAHADVEIEWPHLRIVCTRAASGDATIRYGASLTLPSTIDADSLTADLRDGVLEISMRKSAQARARRIRVQRG